MGRYRLDSIDRLARQMHFAPIAKRLEQLAKAESLLLQIRATQAYTIDQITFAITDFELKHPEGTALAGEALQHDLGLLVEQVSESLQLHVNSIPEPVLTIDEVAQRVSVTTKTVQRWRRRGLPAGRFTFADQKRRIGFRLSNLQRFLSAGDVAEEIQLPAPEHKSRDLGWLLKAAQALADQGFWLELAGQRLAHAARLSPLTVTQLLREQAGQIAFGSAPSSEQRRRIFQLAGEGTPLPAIAAKLHLPSFGLYRVLLDYRIGRAIRKPIRFIDDPLYHQADADLAMDALADESATLAEAAAETPRIPRDLPPYLQDLCRVPPLSAAQERGLFLKYQYLRYRAAALQKAIDPQVATYAQLRRLDRAVREARSFRGRLIEANLRLVVSVSRKHLRPGLSLMELVSEGNLILLRAVDSFDVHRGHRFSTYAVYALMKGFARCIPAMLYAHPAVVAGEQLAEVGDPAGLRHLQEAELRDQVQRLMSRLDERERHVLSARYGLSGSRIPQTFQELGNRLNLSRQRIIQIEQQAMAKLREWAK